MRSSLWSSETLSFDKSVLISGRGPSQNPQIGPNFVQKCLGNFSVWCSNLPVELLSIHDQKLGIGRQNTALDCNATRRCNVVASDHSNSNSGSLAFSNGIRYWKLSYLLVRENLPSARTGSSIPTTPRRVRPPHTSVSSSQFNSVPSGIVL